MSEVRRLKREGRAIEHFELEPGLSRKNVATGQRRMRCVIYAHLDDAKREFERARNLEALSSGIDDVARFAYA